ncbi:LysR family transcriptional regulator [Bacillus sp. FJAT-29953]|nr:LysR family transcriptional regulator [Bacillus sp. FJAT-29953]
MEVRQLEYFAAVCEELNFTKAAERLNISQPSLSQQIKILESNLGVQLFKRTGKKTYMTHAGEILLDHTRNIFFEIDEAKRELNDLQEFKHGKITVGCTGNYLLHSAVMAFHEQYPGVEISLFDVPTSDIIKNILSHQFDLGIVYLPVNEPMIESRLLFQSDFYVIVSVQNEMAEVPSIKLENLQSKKLMFLPKNYFTRQTLDKYCQECGFTIKPTIELSDPNSLYQMTVQNQGITILPNSYLKHIDENKVIKIPIIDPIPLKEVGLIYRKDNKKPSILNTFIEFLVKQYQGSSK